MQVNHNRFLGYTKDANGHLIIEEEAKVVRRIYREYLEGASLNGIGRGLAADGILTGAGKKRWRPETVQKILKNEKYMGDAIKEADLHLSIMQAINRLLGNRDSITDEIYCLREMKQNIRHTRRQQ